MKFLNKYELMEPVTSGAVETFVAREISSGERVIVHMFAGSEVLPDKPALQWALQSLRGLAPTPMGSVIEGGRYEQTSHAYLVTKFPADPVALQHWIRFYRLQAEATQPTLGTPVPLAPTIGTEPEQAGSEKTNRQPVGEFTRAFFGSTTADVGSQSPSASNTLPERKVPSADDNWSRKPAGAFTKEFLSGLDLGPEIKKSSEPEVAAKEPRKPQSFTAEFLLGGNEGHRAEGKKAPTARENSISALFGTPTPKPTPMAPQPPAASQKRVNDPLDFSASAPKAGTGEFTKFFRGPFGGQSSSGAPADIPATPPSRPKERVGEFTQLFGSSSKSLPGKESGALLEPAAPTQSGNFTEVFGPAKRSADLTRDVPASGPSVPPTDISWNEPTPSQAGRPDPSFAVEAKDRAATFREPGTPLGSSASTHVAGGGSTAIFANEIAWDRPAPARPAPAAEGPAGEVSRNVGSVPEAGISAPMGGVKSGATSVFTPPGSGPAAPPVAVPSGPSEYTRIISPPKPAPNEEEKPVPPAPASPAFSLPQVAMPPMPMPPASAPAMPHPQAPQPPHVQLPHMPQPMPMHVPMPAMQAPQVPQVPQAPQGKKIPYWPLIITMNVLLIVAVALILYFALKH
jgi:hypothetical protein